VVGECFSLDAQHGGAGGVKHDIVSRTGGDPEGRDLPEPVGAAEAASFFGLAPGSGRSRLPPLLRKPGGSPQPPSAASAASRVFCIRVATVIGPTPPGTGVIQLARLAAASKPTSPTRRPSSSRLMPTSITTAPGFTQSPGISPGRPTATTSMSASP